jgi:hypothetical protein
MAALYVFFTQRCQVLTPAVRPSPYAAWLKAPLHALEMHDPSPRSECFMDLVFIVSTLLLSALTLGLVGLCAKLLEGRT